MAGFAGVSIANYTIQFTGNGTITFGDDVPELTVTNPEALTPLTQGDDYTVKFYKNNVEVDEEDVVNAGEYQVSAVGKGDYEGETAKITLTILPKSVADFTIVPSMNDDEWEGFTYDGNAKVYDVVKVYEGDPDDGGTLLATINNGDDNENFTVTYATNTNAGTNTAKLKVSGNVNYTGTATYNFSIAKANIPVDELTEAEIYAIPTTVGDLKYTGNYQALVNAGQIPSQYGTFKYKLGNGSFQNAIPTALNAAEEAYSVTWKVVGKNGNYNDIVGETPIQTSIGKQEAKLRIVPINPAGNKAYDGQPILLADAQFSITGWAAGDDAAIQATLTGHVAKLIEEEAESDADQVGPGVGEYTIKANVADAVYTNKGGDQIALSTNYNFTLSTTTWKITQRELNLTIANKEITYGTALPAINAWDPAITVTAAEGEWLEEDNLIDGITLAYGTYIDENEQEQNIAANAVLPYGTYPGAIKATAGEGFNQNYKIKTTTGGNVTVTGAPFSIWAAVPSTIEYSGTTAYADNIYYLAYEDVDEEEDEVEATYDDSKIELIYKNATTGETLEGAPYEIGSYTVEVKPSDEIGTGNYAGVTPTCQVTPFSIVQKTLAIDIEDLSLWNGATETILNQKVTYNNDDIEDAVVEGESVTVKFKFTPSTNESNYTVADGVITFKANYTAGGENIIEAYLEETGDYQNYKIAYVNGTKGLLTKTNIAEDMPLALVFGADDADNIADASNICAANETATYAVTVGNKDSNKKMLAKEWYAMVLPFDVTPADLVAKLGTYVVVNKIKSSSMNAAKEVTVSFELEMDNVEAGTPFIIKPATQVNWYKATDPDDEDNPDYSNSIVFTGKTIKSAINDAETTYATLTGTYENGKSLKWGYDLDGTAEAGWDGVAENATLKYRWLCDTSYGKKDDDGNLVNQWLNCKNNAHSLKPMEAYMVLDPEAVKVNVLVEDFENGTTSIKSLSADNIQGLKVAEGWYTINGMKLNAAPTEKGIYINNGKKVVVK